MPILETKNLYKHFDGVTAVDRLEIAFEAGKITGIIGPNGSGKSTLINLLTGIIPFDGGEIIIAGKEKLSRIPAAEIAVYGMTRTFQEVRLFEQMTVLDNVLVVLTDRNVTGALFEKHSEFHLAQAEAALKKVGLFEKRSALAANLSYGQRKLLEISRVLGMLETIGTDKAVVFFDEPFAGMFPEMIKIVVSVMKELRERGDAVILIEHNMDLIREMADVLYVIDAGKILAIGAPDEVLAKKQVIEAYLGE